METAMAAQPGAEQVAVTAYQLDDDPAHLSINCNQSFSSAASSVLPGCRATSLRPSTTISSGPIRSCQRRKLSLTRRLIRFRRTARAATLRDIARPRRA